MVSKEYFTHQISCFYPKCKLLLKNWVTTTLLTPAPCKDTPAQCKDTPAQRKDTPALCKDISALCKDTPALCKDTPAQCKDTPALCKDNPALCKDTSAPCKDAPALCKGTLAQCKDRQAQCKDKYEMYSIKTHHLDSPLSFHCTDRLVGLVVKASTSRAEDPGFEYRVRKDFSGWSHTHDLKKMAPSGYPARILTW